MVHRCLENLTECLKFSFFLNLLLVQLLFFLVQKLFKNSEKFLFFLYCDPHHKSQREKDDNYLPKHSKGFVHG